MFGLPYIIAPMEAEAQCAYMEINNLVDGVVTDDSDVFLFGARNVYKNIFDDRKYVETYLMKDIESDLGLTREQLIRMALLLGSDYTEGVSGIGIVNAIEVVNAFPEEDGLQKFREWIESPDPAILGKLGMETSGSSKRRKPGGNELREKGNSLQPECVEGPDDNQSSNEKQHAKEVFMSKHRNVSKNWHIPSTFPSETVISAYISPQVDDSTERFSWGRPDLILLRKLCWERFGWNKEKADELLLPVLKEYNKHERLWTLEELSVYNGTDEGLPILLGILGSVFDVTKGRSHYGPGGGYHHFSGRDASRAFVSGNFTGDGLTDSLQGLSSMEVNSIVGWRKFYFERYIFSGKIVGRYYDSQGNPTKYLKGVEMKAKRDAQLLEKQKSEEDKIPNCNSKWSQAEGGEVWCEAGYPRLVRRPGDIALTGQVSQRCACFQESELGRPGLVVYQGCDYLSTSCKVKE